MHGVLYASLQRTESLMSRHQQWESLGKKYKFTPPALKGVNEETGDVGNGRVAEETVESKNVDSDGED